MLDLRKLTEFALASGQSTDINSPDGDVDLTLVLFGPERMSIAFVDANDRVISVGEIDNLVTTTLQLAGLKSLRVTAGPGGGTFFVYADFKIIRNGTP